MLLRFHGAAYLSCREDTASQMSSWSCSSYNLFTTRKGGENESFFFFLNDSAVSYMLAFISHIKYKIPYKLG